MLRFRRIESYQNPGLANRLLSYWFGWRARCLFSQLSYDRNDANPDHQLQEALHIGSDISQLDATYLPVLNNLIMGLSNMRRDRVLQEFRRIVCAIIVLADPLSTSALAQILDIPRENINDRLDMLHSVLSIPPSARSL